MPQLDPSRTEPCTAVPQEECRCCDHGESPLALSLLLALETTTDALDSATKFLASNPNPLPASAFRLIVVMAQQCIRDAKEAMQ